MLSRSLIKTTTRKWKTKAVSRSFAILSTYHNGVVGSLAERHARDKSHLVHSDKRTLLSSKTEPTVSARSCTRRIWLSVATAALHNAKVFDTKRKVVGKINTDFGFLYRIILSLLLRNVSNKKFSRGGDSPHSLGYAVKVFGNSSHKTYRGS